MTNSKTLTHALLVDMRTNWLELLLIKVVELDSTLLKMEVVAKLGTLGENQTLKNSSNYNLPIIFIGKRSFDTVEAIFMNIAEYQILSSDKNTVGVIDGYVLPPGTCITKYSCEQGDVVPMSSALLMTNPEASILINRGLPQNMGVYLCSVSKDNGTTAWTKGSDESLVLQYALDVVTADMLNQSDTSIVNILLHIAVIRKCTGLSTDSVETLNNLLNSLGFEGKLSKDFYKILQLIQNEKLSEYLAETIQKFSFSQSENGYNYSIQIHTKQGNGEKKGDVQISSFERFGIEEKVFFKALREMEEFTG